MYRLVEENKNIHNRHRHHRSSATAVIVRSPSRPSTRSQRPAPVQDESDYSDDEWKMDQVQQQRQRLSMRSSFIEGQQPPSQEHQQPSPSPRRRMTVPASPTTSLSLSSSSAARLVKRNSLEKYSMPLHQNSLPVAPPAIMSLSSSKIKYSMAVPKRQQRQQDPPGANGTQPESNNNNKSSSVNIRRTSSASSASASSAPSSSARKSHPWQTDVKLNRFSGGGGSSRQLNAVASSSTQKSTSNYKQRMQERKAVFGNVAVMEESDISASRDEDDDDDDDDDESDSCNTSTANNNSASTCALNKSNFVEEEEDEDEESDADSISRGDEEELIQSEALELLKSKGFHFQGILQQQYDDDLESVGPSSSVAKHQHHHLLNINNSSSGSLNAAKQKATSQQKEPPATNTRQVLRLDDIQALREKILLQQMERDNSENDALTTPNNNKKQEARSSATDADASGETADEPYDQATSPTSVAAAAAAAARLGGLKKRKEEPRQEPLESSNAPAADDNSDYAKAWRVMRQLKVRLTDVHTADHGILVAMGRKGQDGVVATSEKIFLDTQAFDRFKLRDAVEKRVSQVFTGDHLINGKPMLSPKSKDSSDGDEHDTIAKSLADDAGSLNSDSENGSQKNKDNENDSTPPPANSPQQLRERLSCSFQMFEAMLMARQQASVADNGDDDFTECSAAVPVDAAKKATVRDTAGMIPHSLSAALANSNKQGTFDTQADDDDQTCWTEYTIETTAVVAEGGTNANAVIDNNTSPANSASETKEQSGCLDDTPATIKVSNKERIGLSSILSGRVASPDDSGDNNNDDDDEMYAEYTVQEETVEETVIEALPNAFRSPGQAPLELHQQQDQDDQSYMEMTVQDDTDYDNDDDEHDQNVKVYPSQELRRPPQQQHGDDQSYMELTVQEPFNASLDDSPPTRQPPQRQEIVVGNTDDDGDQSYMEFTVNQDAAIPQQQQQQQQQSSFNDLVSPNMANMLSSRMFSDMELPEALKQKQPQQQALEEDDNNNSYPTITLEHLDDDDMTQLTFDHTMLEEHEPSEYDQNEMDFLHDTSNKQVRHSMTTFSANGSYTQLNDPSIVGSQHTEHTRDTTVSDDASSSQHDAASFKSCVSSESSQFVADLLRRDVWSPDPAVVHAALQTIGVEASKGFHNRANIVRYGGLLAILRAMELKPTHADVQLAACIALEKMASDGTTRVAIGEVGGIAAIGHAMEGHVEDAAVQRAACKALSRLTRHSGDRGGESVSSDSESVPAAGVVKAVTDSMKLHSEDPIIQAHAFGSLANLCLDNQDRLRELKKMGGLATMTMALHLQWENTIEQNEAISTLSILLRSLSSLGTS